MSETIYVVPPNSTLHAREVVLAGAVAEAISFAEHVRDVLIAPRVIPELDDHIEMLRGALSATNTPRPRSGILAQLPQDA